MAIPAGKGTTQQFGGKQWAVTFKGRKPENAVRNSPLKKRVKMPGTPELGQEGETNWVEGDRPGREKKKVVKKLRKEGAEEGKIVTV